MLIDVAFLTINDSQNFPEVAPARFNSNDNDNDNSKTCNRYSDNNPMISLALRELDERDDDIVLRPAHDRGHYSTSVLTQSNSSGQSSFSTSGGNKKGIIQEISFEARSQPVDALAQGR